VHKGKGMFDAEGLNVEFPSSLCVRRGLILAVGLDGGWTFPMGGMNLEMVWMSWTHVGTTWTSTNKAQRPSRGHELQTRGRIRAW
jgi:hypothetical protein